MKTRRLISLALQVIGISAIALWCGIALAMVKSGKQFTPWTIAIPFAGAIVLHVGSLIKLGTDKLLRKAYRAPVPEDRAGPNPHRAAAGRY